MTSVIDPKAIGKPSRPRRHVRTLTGPVRQPLHRYLYEHLPQGIFQRLTIRARKNGPGAMRKYGKQASEVLTTVGPIYCIDAESDLHMRRRA